MPYGPRGVRAELRVNGDIDFDAADTISLQWDDPEGNTYNYQWTATFPANDPDEIPSNANGYASYFEYYQAVAAKMNQNEDISPFWKIYATNNSPGYSLWIEARSLEAGWSVDWSTNNGSFSKILYQSPVADNIPDQYYAQLQLIMERVYSSNEYRLAAELQCKPDPDGNCIFDISKILNMETEDSLPDPPIPSYNAAAPILADVVRRYYLRYQESYASSQEAWTKSAVKYALQGGISMPLFAQLNFFDQLTADNSLLTWMPDGRNLLPTQPEFVSWYNYAAKSTAPMVELVEYDEDGNTTRTYKYDPERVYISPKEVLTIPVGPVPMSLAVGTVKYTIRLIDADSNWEGNSPTYISQLRTYYLDRQYHEQPRFLVYLNSFSCPETLACTGIFEKDIELDRTTGDFILAPNYTATTAERRQTNITWNNIFTYRTGFLSAAELDQLQELLIYNSFVYEVTSQGYVPLYITGDSFNIYQQRRNLNALEIVAEPALQPRNFSGTALVDGMMQMDTWQEIDLDDWLMIFGQPWNII